MSEEFGGGLDGENMDGDNELTTLAYWFGCC